MTPVTERDRRAAAAHLQLRMSADVERWIADGVGARLSPGGGDA